jgi:hypothetical protein
MPPFARSPRDARSRLWPLIALLILVHLSTVLYTLPLNRIIEIRLCQEHYARHDHSSVLPDGSIPEKLCKVDEVQRQLAWLQGIMETTLVVCGACPRFLMIAMPSHLQVSIG